MSLKTDNVQIGLSSTATDNFTIRQPATPDGTVRIANGNSGTTTDLVTVTSAGSVGVGTSSPGDKLTVAGSAAFIKVDRSDGEPGISLRYNGSSTNRGDIAVTTGGAMYFTTGGSTERLRIPSDAGGIQFPATQAASSNANTLDDYEEGTFTPYLQIGGATTGITYSAANGSYTKIGNVVVCRFGMALSNKGSATGQVRLWGLPFSISSLSYADATGLVYGNAFNSVGYVVGLIGYGGTTSAWMTQGGTNSGAVLVETNLTNTNYWSATLVYGTST